MSAPAAIIVNHFKNMMSFFKISQSYFRRRNPIVNAIANFINQLNGLFNLKKQLRSLRYQVHLNYYRMQQMEKLMNEGNPYNTRGGFHINKYR